MIDNGKCQLEPRGYHTLAESGLDQVPVRHMTLNRATSNEERPYLPPSITVLPLPEEASDNIEIDPAPEENGFQDYILILPILT